MTEEKSCRTCRLSSFNNGTGKACGSVGVSDCIGYAKWQPIAQEKPMEKIQMTEEQARELFSDIGLGETVDMAINESKKNGYIRKSAVEEAEEEYIAYKEGKNCFVAEIVMDKMYLAIQELKSEIARLGK